MVKTPSDPLGPCRPTVAHTLHVALERRQIRFEVGGFGVHLGGRGGGPEGLTLGNANVWFVVKGESTKKKYIYIYILAVFNLLPRESQFQHTHTQGAWSLSSHKSPLNSSEFNTNRCSTTLRNSNQHQKLPSRLNARSQRARFARLLHQLDVGFGGVLKVDQQAVDGQTPQAQQDQHADNDEHRHQREVIGARLG